MEGGMNTNEKLAVKMNKNLKIIISVPFIIMFGFAGVFAAENKEISRSTATAAEYESYRTEQKAKISEISDIVKSKKQGKVSALKPLLLHKDPLVRGEAAVAIGRTKEQGALQELLQALNSEDEHIRWGAIEGLAELGDKNAVPTLIKLLDHKDRNTRWKAAQALGKLRDARAIEALVKTAKSDKDKNVRLAAIEALMNIGDKKAISALEGITNDPDAEVSHWAKSAADRLKGKK